MASFLGDEVVIVAPNGYERSWNVYKELFSSDAISYSYPTELLLFSHSVGRIRSQRTVPQERSKADDVKFILDLITKIGQEIPAADMNNVNIAGTSNGAALTYLLTLSTGSDRPFRR